MQHPFDRYPGIKGGLEERATWAIQLSGPSPITWVRIARGKFLNLETTATLTCDLFRGSSDKTPQEEWVCGNAELLLGSHRVLIHGPSAQILWQEIIRAARPWWTEAKI